MNKRKLFATWLFAGIGCVAAQSALGQTVNFTGAVNTDFLNPGNWSDNMVPTADGDRHFIGGAIGGVTADLTGTATVNTLMVGDASVGVLNVNGGTLNVDVNSGFPQGFSLGGHYNNHTGHGTVNVINGGVVNMTRLPGGSPDTAFVGERADAVLNIGPGSSVNAPDFVWRIGQFGGFFGLDLFTAEGTVDLQGNFNSRQIFLGVQGGDGSITISGNGAMNLTGQLHMSIETFRTERSATVTMVGSNASLVADDVLAHTLDGEVRNQFVFIADAGGVSEIQSLDALFFDNAEVTVDLTNYAMAEFELLRLFDAAPGQLRDGDEFGPLNIIGANPAEFHLIWDDNNVGDVWLHRIPEPSSALLALGLIGATMARRRR